MLRCVKFGIVASDGFSMNRESFLDTLRTQYSEKIRTTYEECEHGEKIDFALFKTKMEKVFKIARGEGLSEGDFMSLLESHLPTEIWERLPWFSKDAA